MVTDHRGEIDSKTPEMDREAPCCNAVFWSLCHRHSPRWPKPFAGADAECYLMRKFCPAGSVLSSQILSRNQKDLGSKFPEVNDLIAALDLQDAIIDDEIVRWTKRAARRFSYSKVSTWAK